tara:strand:+ start:1185 stop:2339 length:1155 start_codon:yes stop_codon:yes gene_type:complete
MISKSINFKNFRVKKKSKLITNKLKEVLQENSQIIKSLKKDYKDKFNHKIFNYFNKNLDFRIIGMGGSTLGTQAIYGFLKNKIKKNFYFVDNLQSQKHNFSAKRFNNLVISKSGNTIETIVNSNILIKKNEKSLFLTENKKSYLRKLAQKLKSEIVDHNNYIGGRYSVLSEVGMLPAELMGLKPKNFRQLNNLIKNKSFLKALVNNTSATIYFLNKRKYNSVIINYDEASNGLFNWYRQLIAESLGKKHKGLLPIMSNMPKDNHSVMQLYLDGFKNNFYTFFFAKEKNSEKIKNNQYLFDKKFLKNKSINQIMYAQKQATELVFNRKNIPFRSFEVTKRDEKTLGELFCFFILETILIGRFLKINPFNQPAVELIKIETKKFLI